MVELTELQFDVDNSDDEEYFSDPGTRIILDPNDLLIGDDVVEEGPERRVQTRAERRRQRQAGLDADEDINNIAENFELEIMISTDGTFNSNSESE